VIATVFVALAVMAAPVIVVGLSLVLLGSVVVGIADAAANGLRRPTPS
jgi:hypothetical protein